MLLSYLTLLLHCPKLLKCQIADPCIRRLLSRFLRLFYMLQCLAFFMFMSCLYATCLSRLFQWPDPCIRRPLLRTLRLTAVSYAASSLSLVFEKPSARFGVQIQPHEGRPVSLLRLPLQRFVDCCYILRLFCLTADIQTKRLEHQSLSQTVAQTKRVDSLSAPYNFLVQRFYNSESTFLCQESLGMEIGMEYH